MFFIKRTYYFLYYEYKHLKKYPLPILLALVAPIIVWSMLAYTFTNGEIVNLPVTIVDNDNSFLSRTIERNIDASQALDVISLTTNVEEARNSLLNSKCNFIIIIPKGSEENVKKGLSAEITIISNGANLMYSKVGYKSIAQTLLTISTGILIKKFEMRGLNSEQALFTASPVTTEVIALGNPYFNYGIYMIPGILISILQMSASFSSLWLFRKDREADSGRVIPRGSNKLPFFIGKFTPIFVANTIATITLFAVIFPLSGVPTNDSYIYLFFSAMLLMIVSMGMGALLSIALKNLVTASQVLLVINAPAFVFSGYTFPRWAMPDLMQLFAQISPVTHYLDGFFSIYLFNKPTMLGIYPMITIGFILWALTFAFMSKFGKKIYNKKILSKKN